MNKKRFIAHQGSATSVKVFLAETGQLYRVIDVGGTIVSPPICTEEDMYVSVQDSSGKVSIKYFTVPGFNIKRVTTL
jgi:hypothetical protein